MAMHNPPRIGPSTAPPSEWDENIQRMRPRLFDHTKHNKSVKVQTEARMNQPVVWQSKRGYLGVGSSLLAPYGEYILPKNINASNLLGRIDGITEGERLELLPEGTPIGYRSNQVAPERVFVYRRSTAKEDFVVPQGRIIRLILTRTKSLYL